MDREVFRVSCPVLLDIIYTPIIDNEFGAHIKSAGGVYIPEARRRGFIWPVGLFRRIMLDYVSDAAGYAGGLDGTESQKGLCGLYLIR